MHLVIVGGRRSAGSNAHVFSTHPTNPRQDAIDFNRVILRRRKKQVESLLQKIEPRLQSIESLQTGSEPLLYADIGLSEMIPVTQLGQGFNRLLDIYSELVAAEAKVLLIDEIENGLHHSVLKTVWTGLFTAAAEMDVQIFATTHSWECVLAADEAAAKQTAYDLNLIRLDRVDDNVKATVIDRPAFETAKQLGWEMR
jgi:AAA15 family ATPase/GTPase